MPNKIGNSKSEMSFWDHLDELRGVIVRSVLVVVVVFVALFFFKDIVFDSIILRPTRNGFWMYRLLNINLDINLINIDVSAQFFTHIKVTLICSLVVCFPLISYFIWQFVVPALYDKERKVVKKAFALGAGLFYLGIVVSYFFVMPIMLVFFNGYQVSTSVVNTFSLTSYISIFLTMVFLMGLMFEFPSVLAVLSHFGLIDREVLKKYRRHAIVILVILAAVITPTGDPVTMLIVALPLYILYEFSILICKP